MDKNLEQTLGLAANTIRVLSFEGVQKANSGHPGLPMGCAEFGAYLYGQLLKHSPKNSQWLGRDRFILSAGHGSMFLYSLLHLSGFKLSLDELKRFRQLHSHTPGHPEYGDTDGVETTTGPLGQGIGNAVGQALGLKLLQERLDPELFGGKVYCLAGDGCLMEGVSHEACGFAGHLQLDNLVLIHDANKITLDGPLSQSGSEHSMERFRAYGFDVYEMDGNNIQDVAKTMQEAVQNQKKPIYIHMHTIIGKGSPNKQNTHKAHGSPLGEEECALVKKELDWPEEPFYIPQAVQNFFKEGVERGEKLEKQWNEKLELWKKQNSEKAALFDAMIEKKFPDDLEKCLMDLEIETPISGRKASQAVLQKLAEKLPFLYGGSADLSGSDCTMLKEFPLVEPGKFGGRNIKYGIREFGMATIAAGLWQTGMIRPYVGTFLTFSDYMRNAIRLAALSSYRTIYQFTHDSIFLGEDGPTHQSIEHAAALRAMPNLWVFRPGSEHEVKCAWLSMLQHKGPSAIILTRQNLKEVQTTHVPYKEGAGRGAYIVKKESGQPDYCLMATGSELPLAMEVAVALEKMGKSVRVVSMPCWELFQAQDKAYIDSVLGGDLGKRVCIEAACGFGWERWIGRDGISITMDGYGLSAPAAELAEEFGFTVDHILERIL